MSVLGTWVTTGRECRSWTELMLIVSVGLVEDGVLLVPGRASAHLAGKFAGAIDSCERMLHYRRQSCRR